MSAEGIDENPLSGCKNCEHEAMRHYIRKGKYSECGFCSCSQFYMNDNILTITCKCGKVIKVDRQRKQVEFVS